MRFRYSAGEDGALVRKAVIYTRDEHGINFADVDSYAVSIVKKLRDFGFETYIVGGAVRDLILGKKPKDFDIVSAASPLKIRKVFRNSRIIGRRFRLVHVSFGQKIFEVSTFRSLKDGLTSNTFGTVDEDVLRRDFTMNALLYDPAQQIVVDYVGGMKDIQKKLVKPIIPITTIFTDDPVRMIRAVKYSVAADFSLPLNLVWKIKSQSNLLSSISPSRLTEEIFKIVNSPKASEIVEALYNVGIYSYLQPRAAKMMRENNDFKKSYLQSMSAMANAPVKASAPDKAGAAAKADSARAGASAVNSGASNRSGQAVWALVNNYLEDIADWEKGIAEHYKILFQEARSFILPMSPPRFEVGKAVRSFFADHGVIVKKMHLMPHFADRGKHASEGGETGGSAAKKRRRRRRKPMQENVK